MAIEQIMADEQNADLMDASHEIVQMHLSCHFSSC